jgi:serine/threonine-protein kinase RsbW
VNARVVELTVTSEIENVSLLGLCVNRLAESCGMDEMERFHVELCIVEAATNVVLHAYEGAPGRRVTLLVTVGADVLQFRLRDDGKPIPEERRGRPPDPEETEDALLREGGRGLYLIHRLMDRVSYTAGPPTNELVMEKGIPAVPGP